MDTVNMIKDIMNKYYVTKEIEDSDDFKKICSENISLDQFNTTINNLIKINDGDFIDDVIYIGFVLNFFNQKNEYSLRRVLSLDSHKKHEDIAGLFQRKFFNNIDNITSLLHATLNIPKYLEPDDFKYPYIRKLIYAIGAQPEPNNIETLKNLTLTTSDQKIKQLALNQINKRAELGRWEAKSH